MTVMSASRAGGGGAAGERGAMDTFFNRELSWLAFNTRVIEEAEDTSNPLLERLKFVSIVSSNLDEFYMIRVGSLWDQIKGGVDYPDAAGLTPMQQIEKINRAVHEMYRRQYAAYFSLLDRLREESIRFHRYLELDGDQRDHAERYYRETVYPVLTPIVVDQSRPFPLIQNKSLNVGVLLENPRTGGGPLFATVQVPSVLPRYIGVPSADGTQSFIVLEKIIKEHLGELFDSHRILTYGHYRITRNADLGYDEEEAEDLLAVIQETLKQRKWGKVVRLEVQADMDERLRGTLRSHLEVTEREVFGVVHSIDLTFLSRFVREISRDSMLYAPFKPAHPFQYKDAQSFFRKLQKRDILLHHPYDSFRPVLDMVRFAASDERVLAIKMTLYRVSGQSPVIEALAQAAERGKQVTVLVELKARFDEESNIHWAKKLEKAGAHVIYGLVGLKTHCKLLLVVRQEKQRIARYVHLSTGNYNDETAQLYVDLGLMTGSKAIGEDVTAIFNSLSGYTRLTSLRELVVAPHNLREWLYGQIDREIEAARQGQEAHITAKINSLIDDGVIEKLYEASAAGVRIELLVRGICGLRPGVPGLSENIMVRSIVGRFLEHSRIFRFANRGEPLYYLSSADLMRRNLDRRFEVTFPVRDGPIRDQLERILQLYFSDNVKSRELLPDGRYVRCPSGDDARINSQEEFIRGIG